MHPIASAPGFIGEHTSTPVQYFPSSQDALFAVCVGAPFVHASVVHAMPSSGITLLSTACPQPITASQLSTVHGLLSLQLTALPPVHIPAWQLCPLRHSVVEHALPFGSVLCMHEPLTTVSVVQGFWSSHTGV